MAPTVRMVKHVYQCFWGVATAVSPSVLQLFSIHGDVPAAGGRRPSVAVPTRTERWFFLPPFPAAPLFVAIVLTQIVAVLMCAFGWLVPAIPWTLIGWVWAYNIAWMFVLGAVRLITERFATYRTVRQARSVRLVSQALQPQAPA
jgi:hypothetical protein